MAPQFCSEDDLAAPHPPSSWAKGMKFCTISQSSRSGGNTSRKTAIYHRHRSNVLSLDRMHLGHTCTCACRAPAACQPFVARRLSHTLAFDPLGQRQRPRRAAVAAAAAAVESSEPDGSDDSGFRCRLPPPAACRLLPPPSTALPCSSMQCIAAAPARWCPLTATARRCPRRFASSRAQSRSRCARLLRGRLGGMPQTLLRVCRCSGGAMQLVACPVRRRQLQRPSPGPGAQCPMPGSAPTLQPTPLRSSPRLAAPACRTLRRCSAMKSSSTSAAGEIKSSY